MGTPARFATPAWRDCIAVPERPGVPGAAGACLPMRRRRHHVPCIKTLIPLRIRALVMLQATGMDVVIAPQDCERSRATDAPDGMCAPLCSDCYCCPTLRTCAQA